MSKLAVFFVAAPALVGVGVLAVVNLELSSELATTRSELADLERAVRDLDAPPPEPTGRTGERREDARIRSLEDRLAALETRSIEPAVARMPDEGEAAAAPATLVAGGTEIERAVTQVLEARDAERRLERRGQMVERGAERLLRDVEVSDEQRARVQGLVADNVRKQEEMRSQDLGPELTAERAQELRDELLRGLEGVLDATQMAIVAPRLERRSGEDRVRGAERRGGRRGGRAGLRRAGGDG